MSSSSTNSFLAWSTICVNIAGATLGLISSLFLLQLKHHSAEEHEFRKNYENSLLEHQKNVSNRHIKLDSSNNQCENCKCIQNDSE
jgi:hypothetical protein